ncbi:helix-turn-helix transcriptional regulator [Parvibium lacunae]|uniref:YafY family transcriptional regulator n=1 Tax=Parvibium lacunae TaxID=1888893 RepID=A0A368L7G7_9BURK|nr:YafY family protein [Parvibium lacunae]RCS59451.1 YafY family transcriptional regulator [Parvibium lacunae]
MRRADRLFQITQILRGRRNTTAKYLAERLGVGERTIYRDIRDLGLSGVPIEGEAGVGYRLKQGFDLPPLMFNIGEIHAMVAGLRLISTWGGNALKQQAHSVLEKIYAILPIDKQIAFERTPLFAPEFVNASQRGLFDQLHQSCQEQQKVLIRYRDGQQNHSERIVHPLALFFWGNTWTLLAWCELRQAFRSFRSDRITEAELLDQHFISPPGQQLQDYLRLIEHECDTTS